MKVLFRVHGSSVYKGSILGFVSVAIYLLILYIQNEGDAEELDHPYATGVLVSSVFLLLVFRANYAYKRYWEACTAVFHMISKWLDATSHAGVYHLQCKHFDSIKPPSFFDHHELNFLGLTRDRERERESLAANFEEGSTALTKSDRDAPERSINKVDDHKSSGSTGTTNNMNGNDAKDHRLYSQPRLDGGMKQVTLNKAMPSNGQDFTPSLFLQELCHLSSLMVAVAFSTLRNDIEGSPSPLDLYVPGQPWPEVDPDKLPHDQKLRIHSGGILYRMVRSLQYWAGLDRTPAERTKYNAARPMQVLGGVSDAEILLLQRARGASAKTEMAWKWLSEYIIREHLAGSLGSVHPAIVSRCIQFFSDGMIWYNHARKIMFVPYPFVSAQISAFFVVVIVAVVPFMMHQYANITWLGALLTFFTVTCLCGLHEAAREMENPFRNIPNDIPLCTLMAMYNESLLTLYNGYHPDSFWDPKAHQPTENNDDKTDEGNNVELHQLRERAKRQASELEELKTMVEKMAHIKAA